MGWAARHRTPLAVWSSLTIVVIVLSHVASRVTRPGYRWGQWPGIELYLDGLVQYDGHRYLDIATHGYSYTEGVQSTIVWFPLYPLAIRAVQVVARSPMLAAVFVTVVAAGAASVLYWRWLERHEMDGPTRTAAFAALVLYPYAWFLYGTVYADALALALALGALGSVERDRMVLGGLLGALAVATRPSSAALVPALALLAMVRHGVLTVDETAPAAEGRPVARLLRRARGWLQLPTRFHGDRLRPATLAPLLSAGGLLAYAGYLWVRFGDPLIFLTNQRTFHGGRYPLLKGTFISRMVHFPETPVHSLTLLAQAVLTLAALASVGAVARRFGAAYGVLVLGTVAIVLVGTHDFMGAGRYLLGAFPVLALAGERLAARGRRVAVATLAASGTAMLVMSFAFSRSVYLS